MITVPKSDLIRAVSRCASIASARSPMPVLSCVLVESDGERVTVTSTDMFTATRATVQCATGEASFAVQARDLLERLKHMPDGSVSLAHEKGRLRLSAPKSSRRYDMLAHDGSEFPRVIVATEDGAPPIVIAGDVLARAIDSVSYAVSVDETRAHVNSALLEIGDGVLRLVATDGHRLSKFETTVDSCETVSALVPLKSLLEIRKMCGASSVALRVSGPNIYIETDDGVLSAKLVNAQFPPWKQIVPIERTRVRAPRSALESAIDSCGLVARAGKSSGVKLTFLPGLVRVSAATPEGGEAVDEVACDTPVGMVEISVGFAPQYITAPLSALDCADVIIDVGDELAPLTITAVDDVRFLAVVMPMKL